VKIAEAKLKPLKGSETFISLKNVKIDAEIGRDEHTGATYYKIDMYGELRLQADETQSGKMSIETETGDNVPGLFFYGDIKFDSRALNATEVNMELEYRFVGSGGAMSYIYLKVGLHKLISINPYLESAWFQPSLTHKCYILDSKILLSNVSTCDITSRVGGRTPTTARIWNISARLISAALESSPPPTIRRC
jgi:hypothetical protein